MLTAQLRNLADRMRRCPDRAYVEVGRGVEAGRAWTAAYSRRFRVDRWLSSYQVGARVGHSDPILKDHVAFLT